MNNNDCRVKPLGCYQRWREKATYSLRCKYFVRNQLSIQDAKKEKRKQKENSKVLERINKNERKSNDIENKQYS